MSAHRRVAVEVGCPHAVQLCRYAAASTDRNGRVLLVPTAATGRIHGPVDARRTDAVRHAVERALDRSRSALADDRPDVGVEVVPRSAGRSVLVGALAGEVDLVVICWAPTCRAARGRRYAAAVLDLVRGARADVLLVRRPRREPFTAPRTRHRRPAEGFGDTLVGAGGPRCT